VIRPHREVGWKDACEGRRHELVRRHDLDPHELDLWLAAGCLVLLAAAIGARLSVRTGLPTMLLYLGLGLLVGEAGLGFQFSDAVLTQSLGLVALAVILAEGGLSTRFTLIRPALGFALVLSTVGVVVSVLVVAAGAHWVLDFDTRNALLLGAVVASTDAAAVFSVLRNIPLPRRVVSPLEAESGFNDAPVVILVTLLASDSWATTSVWSALGDLVFELGIGAAVGLAFGWAGAWLLSRSSLPAAGLYPVATIAIALLSYAGAGILHASGFLAVYLTALWLGNARLPHKRATLAFSEGVAWLAQIGLFVLLGLLASPSRLPDAIVPALVAGFILTFLARPISVLISALPFSYKLREQAFLSWAGLRGAVPIVLTTIPLSSGLPGSQKIFDIVFVLVVVFTIIQGPTLPLVARRLRITEVTATRDLSVDAAPLDEMHADLLQFTVPPGSHLHGVTIDELRLPPTATVSLVVRNGRASMPDPHLRLRRGDQILIVATAETRAGVEARLLAVNESGRLARWVGDVAPVEAKSRAMRVLRKLPFIPGR
jgi:cell volume regulation protein A